MGDDTATGRGKIDYAAKYPLTFGPQARKRRSYDTAERQRRAWETARLAADVLRTSFQATRVVVFGSLIQPDRFTPRSDIDLAAWGVPDERYYAAVAAVTGLTTEFFIDVIDVDTCRPSIRKAILEAGVDV